MSQIAILPPGRPEMPRYLLCDTTHAPYWTAQGWSPDRWSARLFSEIRDVAVVYKQLQDAQHADKQLRVFTITTVLRVRADQECLLDNLQECLYADT
jgi:hypothetical protein